MSAPVLDPDLLKAFVAVADLGSFTRAAAALNRTQSAVSMQIKRLEQLIGAELFSRSKVNVALSSAGEELLVYARRILHLNEEAFSRLREGAIEGVVRIGVMDDYGSVVMPPLLSRFIRKDACSANGQWRHSIVRGALGAWPSSAIVSRLSKPLLRKALL